MFEDFHRDTGVAGTHGAGQDLQGAPLVLDRVVPSHFAGALETEDFIQRPISVPGTIGRRVQFSRHGEPEVVAGQEVPQHGVGLVDGPGSGQTQFHHQPVLEGSGGAFHPALGLGRAGEDLLDAQFRHGLAEVGGLHRRLDVSWLAGKLEHAVAVAVERDGPAPVFDQTLHQGEVAAGVLLETEHRVDHGAGGIVHRQQQGE